MAWLWLTIFSVNAEVRHTGTVNFINEFSDNGKQAKLDPFHSTINLTSELQILKCADNIHSLCTR